MVARAAVAPVHTTGIGVVPSRGLPDMLISGGIGRTWVRGQSFKLTGSSDYAHA
jgi:hypothetical protein